MRKQLLSFVFGLAAVLGVTVTVDASTITFTQNGPVPPPSIQTAGGWDGGYIELTQEVNSQNNQVAFDQLVSGAYKQMKFDFDFKFSVGNGGGADGVGFAYANSTNFGTTGSVPAFSEEANLAGSLGVGFDTFNNADLGDGGESTVSLHFNNATLASQSIDASVLGTFENGQVHHATISVLPVAGGSNVSVSVTRGADTITPFSDYFVAGLNPYDGRMVFNARTGGANSKQDIDNVQLYHVQGANDPTTTVLYTFVPEPASFTLIGMGMGLLGLARRRR